MTDKWALFVVAFALFSVLFAMGAERREIAPVVYPSEMRE